MLRMKYVWTLLMVVVFAAMASSMAFAQWIAVDYDEPVTWTDGPEATVDSAATFSDVDTDAAFWGYIEECAVAASAASEFVVGGYPDGSYQPTWDVNRAQMAVFVARAAGLTDAAPETPTFDDVNDAYWAYQEIEACVANSVVSGYPDGLYRPGNQVTRGQMAAYMVNATGGSTEAYTADRFADVEEGDPFADYIEACVTAEIVAGYPDGFYRPNRVVNRGEMCVFVWRALVNDVVLGSGGTLDAALDPGGEDTALLIMADGTGPTDAASEDLGENVFAYVVLDCHKVATGNVVFSVDGATAGQVGTDTVAVANDDASINAGNLPNMIVSYEIPSGLAADTYTVTVDLPGGATLTLGEFEITA
ncbi:MAG: S-layer homology domain-containing protein [Armatimonadetes bacterium]|nr:S-layer homology domain-containing protein [Armatimonadota bacterium]